MNGNINPLRDPEGVLDLLEKRPDLQDWNVLVLGMRTALVAGA